MDRDTFNTVWELSKVGAAVSVDLAKKAAYYCWIPGIILVGAYKVGLKPKDAVKVFTPFL